MYLKYSLPKDTKGTPNLVDLESVRRFQPIQAIETQSQISKTYVPGHIPLVWHKFAPVDVVVYPHYLRRVSSQFSTRDDALGAVLAAQGPTFTEFWAPNLGGFLEGKSPKILGKSRLVKYYLGGETSNIVYVHPENWGRFQFDKYFSDWLKPPSSY